MSLNHLTQGKDDDKLFKALDFYAEGLRLNEFVFTPPGLPAVGDILAASDLQGNVEWEVAANLPGLVSNPSGTGIDNVVPRFDGSAFCLQSSSLIITDTGLATGLAEIDLGTLNFNSGTSTITATGADLTLTAPGNFVNVIGEMSISNNLYVFGTTFSSETETVLIDSNFLNLNSNYQLPVAQEGGLTVNFLPTATMADIGVGDAFVAGVDAVSNPTVATTQAAVFAADDIIQISMDSPSANDGLYEVLSHAANVLTIKGIGTTDRTERFVKNQFVADTGIVGTIFKVTISIITVDTSGDWFVGKGSVTGFTKNRILVDGDRGFGSMMILDNQVTNTVIGGIGTPVVIAGTYVAGSSLNQFALVGTNLTYSGGSTKVFKITINASIFKISGQGIANVTVRIFLNGSSVANSVMLNLISNLTDPQVISTSAIISLDDTDTVEAAVSNETSTVDVRVVFMNVTITEV